MTESGLRDPQNNARTEVIAELRRGRPLGEVAQEYGLLVADLCRWIAETVTVFESGTFRSSDVDDELRRLRLENECLRKQRDFYRKAAGIISHDLTRAGSNAGEPLNGDLV